jgi:hypothetical protein
MNRKPLIRSALGVAVASLASMMVLTGATGQNMLEILALRHRTVDQVLPDLRPLLEPGGALTGQGNQLIVRTSPANLEELKRAIAAIDRPLRRLQISVRFDDTLATSRRGVAASGQVGGRDSGVQIRAYDEHASAAERVDQRLQVVEGGRAYISAGRFTPEPYGLRERTTGFQALPRLSGDRVYVDIAPQRQSADRDRYIATTVSARLGEWFEVGGVSASGPGTTETSRVWLKVEEARP